VSPLETLDAWFRGDPNVSYDDAIAALDDVERELDKQRHRLFAIRQVEGSHHSTACSIWGDDGQGGTREGFKQPLPCNCGALINFANRKRDEALARAEAAEAKALECQCSLGDRGEDCPLHGRVAELEAQLEEARADVGRLDWLDEHGATGEVCEITDDPQDGCRWFINPCYEGDTLRQAIDAAMSAAEGESDEREE
jgi:hypothetical protein